MESRLYEGTVMHARSRPAKNSFRYRVWLAYLDLAELEELDGSVDGFGYNTRAWAVFRAADHGPRDGSPLRPWIDEVLAGAGIDLAGGPVRILTLLRGGPFGFYPVSFWYCFDADGLPRAVLAEVQNTYRDRHNYLLHRGGEVFDWRATYPGSKAFFVSPFIRRENVDYTYRFSEPGDRLSVAISDFLDGERVLTASVSLETEPFTDAALSRAVRRMGPMSARALVLIHWQALRLLLKRVPIHPHFDPPDEETTL